MEFKKLKRRELQALCKLNKIPANRTNVDMVAALSSLNLVVGIEDYLKPSESTDSSVESLARNQIIESNHRESNLIGKGFEKLKRRELQALCKLNKIPANITNAAMIDALSKLDLLVGIENYLRPLESTKSSVESLETIGSNNMESNEESDSVAMNSNETFEQEFVAIFDGVDTAEEADAATEDPSHTFEPEFVAAFKGIDTHGEPAASTKHPSHTFEQENVDTDEKSDVVTKDPSVTFEEEFIVNFEGVDTKGDSDAGTEDPKATFEDEFVATFEGKDTHGEPAAATNYPSESFELENVDIDGEADTEDPSETTKQDLVATFKGVDTDGESDAATKDPSETFEKENVDSEKTAAVIESMVPTSVPRSFFLSSIPCSAVNAFTISKTTSFKQSAARRPSQSRKTMALVSDNKENIYQSTGTKLHLIRDDAGMKTKTAKDQEKALHEASLRQLRKMLREKLQITKNVNTNKVPKTSRPALQTLSSNSMPATKMGN